MNNLALKTWYQNLTLKLKIIVVFLPLIVGMIMVGMFTINSITKQALNQNLNSNLRIISNIAAEAVKTGLEFGDKETIEQAIKVFRDNEQVAYISVFDASGEEVSYYRDPNYPPLKVRSLAEVNDSDIEIFSEMAVQSGNDQIGKVILSISLIARDEALSYSSNVLMGLALFGVILLTIGILFGVKLLTAPINKLSLVADAVSLGDVDHEIAVEQNDEIGKLANSFQKMIESIRDKAQAAEEISRGNLTAEVRKLSDKDQLGSAMERMKNSLLLMQDNMNTMIKGQQGGDVESRCDTGALEGAYAGLLVGVNSALDAVTGPVIEAIGMMHEYAAGNFEKEMRPLPGKQIILTEGMNSIRNNLLDVISGMDTMYKEQKAGDIEYYLDPSKFVGAFKEVATGYNEAVKLHVDNILAILNLLGAYAAGDFSAQLPPLPGKQKIANEIMDKLRDNLTSLIEEITNLVNHSLKGDLSVRTNAEKFAGGYKEVLSGVNQTIDAMIEPVNEAINCLEQMAQGDLTVEVTGDYQGDHAKMKEAMNATLGSLNSILGQVQSAVEQINNGSGQVSDSSQSVSQGATEQASSLEEITSSMSEIGSQSKQNSENAAQANQLTASARKGADDGNEQMGQMLSAMDAISDSSNQISKIIKVIDEIAFQTNLLALNAAVEAARAGVHGKGFAVVAEEVRNLAQRSAKAARETTELIEGSVDSVKHGSKIAKATAEALHSIIEGITKVSDLVGEISSASSEQVLGIEQVSQGLHQIDQVTQSNTASAEESASAAEELSGQAAQLRQMISKFRLKNIPSYRDEDQLTQLNRRTPEFSEIHNHAGNGNGKTRKNGKKKSEDIIVLDDEDFGSF